MKLKENQITYIDRYLQFLGVKFLDVRIELIDHLASQFENDSEYVLLEDFLRTKKGFVRAYQKNLDKKRHWSYQKSLFKRIAKFFVSPKYLLITLLIGGIVYLSEHYLGRNYRNIFCLTTLIIPQILHYYLYSKPKGMNKKIQSAKYIISIMSIPSMFLYVAWTAIESENTILFMLYWFLGIIFNISGIVEVIACRNKIVKTYTNLITA